MSPTTWRTTTALWRRLFRGPSNGDRPGNTAGFVQFWILSVDSKSGKEIMARESSFDTDLTRRIRPHRPEALEWLRSFLSTAFDVLLDFNFSCGGQGYPSQASQAKCCICLGVMKGCCVLLEDIVFADDAVLHGLSKLTYVSALLPHAYTLLSIYISGLRRRSHSLSLPRFPFRC